MTREEQRFIEAFNYLMDNKRLVLRRFCSDAGVNVGTFADFKRGDSNRHAKVEWFAELCRYGVSADWLLTGRGHMMQSQPKVK